MATAESHEIVPPFMMRAPLFSITLRSLSTEEMFAFISKTPSFVMNASQLPDFSSELSTIESFACESVEKLRPFRSLPARSMVAFAAETEISAG